MISDARVMCCVREEKVVDCYQILFLERHSASVIRLRSDRITFCRAHGLIIYLIEPCIQLLFDVTTAKPFISIARIAFRLRDGRSKSVFLRRFLTIRIDDCIVHGKI